MPETTDAPHDAARVLRLDGRSFHCRTGQATGALHRDRWLVASAHAPHLDREVLIHRPAGEQADATAAVRMLAAIKHPGVPTVVAAGDIDGRPAVVTVKPEGRSLREIIASEAEPAISHRIRRCLQVGEVIAAAHVAGICHGALHPNHIVESANGSITVLGWGPRAAPPLPTTDGRWLAPEWFQRYQLDPRSDVYLLGMLWHAILLGSAPVVATPDVSELLAQDDGGAPTTVPSVDLAEDPAAQMERLLALPEEVTEVLEACLSADPAARPADAGEAIKAFRPLVDHQAAVFLCRRAQQTLIDGAKDLAAHQRAIADLLQAQQLHPGHQRTTALLAQARMGAAKLALDAKQAALAIGLLDTDNLDQAGLARALQRRQRRRAVVSSTLRWTAAAVLAGAAAWGLHTHFAEPVGGWTIAQRQVFAEGGLYGLSLTELQVRQVLPLPKLVEGALPLPTGHLLWLDQVRERGPVRVTVDLEWPQQVDGFEILTHAERENPPAPYAMPRSYACQFGGERGMIDFISVNAEAGYPAAAAARNSTFRPRTRYRLAMTVDDERIALSVDGQEVLSRRNLLPVVGRDADRIALRGWSTALIHAIQVERLTHGPVIAESAIGRALLASGDVVGATAALEQAAGNASGRTQARILSQAFLAACLDPQLAPAQQRLLARLRDSHPGSPEIADCEQAHILGVWRSGAYASALRLLRESPDQRRTGAIAMEILAERPAGLSEAQLKELFALLPRNQVIPFLNLSRLGLSDLEMLRGLRIGILQVRGNRIGDLSPLAGMPLRQLALDQNPVADLAPIAACPIERLSLVETQVASTEVIAGMQRLRDLNISGCPLPGLHGLEQLPLTRLEATGIPLVPAQALSGMPLDYLAVGHRELTDLESLRGLRLRQLHVSAGKVASLEPVRGMPLNRLTVLENLVEDLSPLAGMPLVAVDLTGNRITSLDALAGMELTRANLARNRITSIQPLRRARLTTLDISDNPLGDADPLQPIAYHPLHQLSAANCGITSLRSLADLSPATIDLRGNPITSLAGLENARISRQLGLVDCPVPPAERLRLAAAWEARGASPFVVKRLRIEAALATGDPAQLRALADPIDRRVHLGFQATLEEARSIAAKHGARLPVLPDAASQDRLVELLGPANSAWLDLDREGDTLVWRGGAPPAWMANFQRSASTQPGVFLFHAGRQISWNMPPVMPRPDMQAKAGVVLEYP